MASKTFARRMLFSTTRRLASSEGSSSSSSSNISATAQYDSSLGRTVQSHGASSSSSSFSNAAPSSTQSLLRTGLNNLAAPTASAPALRTFSPRQYAAPHDLSPTEMFNGPSVHRPKKPQLGPSRKQVVQTDPFLALGIDPLKECRNHKLFNEYLTNLGRIMPRSRTGLSWKNQRKLGQAVRRARCMGVLPYWNKAVD